MVKAHVRLWLIGIFLMVVAIPFVMSPDFARQRIQAEYAAAVAIFGQDRINQVTDSANARYEAIMQATGLGAAVDAAYVREADMKNVWIAENVNRDMSAVSNKYLLTFTTQIYGVIFRTSLMMTWLVYVGFFLAAAFIDGIAQRQVKQDLLQMHAPIKFAMSSHMAVLLCFTPIAYLLLPVSVSPWFMPVWSLLMAYPIATVVANFARIR